MRSKIRDKILSIFICTVIIISLFPNITVHAANDDQVKASIKVNPTDIYEDDEVEVTISLEGIPYQGKIMPTDVVLVIDRSGSMGNDVSQMVTAAKDFVDGIDFSKHRMGVISYDHRTNSIAITNDTTKLKSFIDTIKNEGGGTDIAQAVDEAVKLLKNKRAGAQGSIVLMTDGESDEAAALQAAARAKSAGYVMFTVAFTSSENSPANLMLKKMATSETDHYFVNSPTALPTVYQKISAKIGYANAKNVSVSQYISDQFEYVQGSADSNIPQPYINGQNLIWKMNQLGQGTATLSYKIKVKDSTLPGTYQHVSTGSVGYTDYNGNTRSILLDKVSIKVKKHAPQITAINQTDFDADGGENVLVQGKYINDNAIVKLGSTVVSKVTISNNNVSFAMPAHVVGSDVITIVNPDKQVSNGQTVNFVSTAPLPSLTLTPDNGLEKRQVKVVATGIPFMASDASQLEVTVGGKSVQVVSYSKSSHKVIFYVPNTFSAGDIDIIIKDKDGRQYSGVYTCTPTPKPQIAITNVTPDSATVNTQVKVTITGTNFSNGKMKVTLGNTEMKLLTCSATKIIFYAPKSKTAETVKITVTRTDWQQSIQKDFTYKPDPVPIIKPIITTATPLAGVENKQTKVVITGKNFNNGNTKVTVGGTAVQLLTCTATKLIFYTPTTFSAGQQEIKVTRTDLGTFATTTFTFTDDPNKNILPTINTVTPNTGIAGDQTKVVIAGTNFKKDNMKVTVGGTEVQLLTCTDSKLIFYVPNTFTAGIQQIKVTRTDIGKTATADFEYMQKPVPILLPDIKGITPNTSVAGVQQKVIINGSNFKDGGKFKVLLGTTELQIVSVTDAKIIAYVPTSIQQGVCSLTVVNYDGKQDVMPNAYTVTSPAPKPTPNVTSITPTAGVANAQYKVVIEGTDFKGTSGDTVVTFGGKTVQLLTNTDTKVIFYPPKLPIGTYDIVITNSYGKSTTVSYTVN